MRSLPAIPKMVYVHLAAGRLDPAIELLRRHLMKAPGDSDAQLLLGDTLSRTDRLEQAIFYLEQAAASRPLDPARWQALALAVQRSRGLDAAEAVLRNAPPLSDGSPSLRSLLADILEKGHRVEEAAALYRDVLSKEPANISSLLGLGRVLMSAGQTEDGLASIRRATQAAPADLRARAALCFHLNYSSDVTRQEVFKEHTTLLETIRLKARPAAPIKKKAGGRVRLGFMSADLRRHSVAYFFEPLLEHLDRSKFKVMVFPTMPQQDEVTVRLRSKTEVWRNVAAEDATEMAAAVLNERPDVLIDLGGLTGPARVIAMSSRLAPVQATYLGYPNTSGVPNVDWRIVDNWTDPPGPSNDEAADNFATESLIRIEGGFLCYRPDDDAPPVASIPARPITFGSFNSALKISPACVRLWAKVLRRVQGSRLLLEAASLRDQWPQDQFRAAFAREGVGDDQVIFSGWSPALTHHLSDYHAIDVALDTYPYNGTTTTCEALWMGVPVVTRTGESHASRVGLSLLNILGQSENAAKSDDEFVARAVALATDRTKLAATRASFRDQISSSPLCDGQGFARRFGAVIERMLSVHPGPEAPQPVPLTSG